MRRRTALLVAGLLAVGLVGCDEPEAPTSSFRPELHVCHPTMAGDRSPVDYTPVPCSTRHESETFLVGLFTGPDAALAAPPAVDADPIWQVYASCDTGATSFLGGEWRESRLTMQVLVPSPERWSAGERWYRCDVVEMVALDQWEPVLRATSLRDSLLGNSPLRLGCFDKPVFDATGWITTAPPASCTGRHDTEFVGVWQDLDTPGGEGVTEEAIEEEVTAGCLRLAAEFVRVPEKLLSERMRVRLLWPGSPEWQAGVPGALCLLQAPQSSLTRSLKGAGIGALPAAG